MGYVERWADYNFSRLVGGKNADKSAKPADLLAEFGNERKASCKVESLVLRNLS